MGNEKLAGKRLNMPRLFDFFSHALKLVLRPTYQTEAQKQLASYAARSCMYKIDINLNHNPVVKHTRRQQQPRCRRVKPFFFSSISHEPCLLTDSAWLHQYCGTFWRSILPYYYYMGCKGMKKFICSSWSILCFARCCAKRFPLKHSATKWSSTLWSFQYFFFASAVHSFLLEKKHYVESAKAVVKLSVCWA